MKVSDILRVKGGTLYTISPDQQLAQAVTTMAENDIGSLVVMDHGQMAGMLTFAEVLEALAQRQGQLGDLKVSEIYVRDPLIATPHLDVICAEILQNDGSIIRARSVQGATQARKSHVLSRTVKLRDKSSVAIGPIQRTAC